MTTKKLCNISKAKKYYINTSLLVNIKLWNKNKYSDRIFKYYEKYFDSRFLDNEYFNMVVNDCKTLELKYSYTEDWRNDNSEISCSSFSKTEYQLLNTHILTPIVVVYLVQIPMQNNCSNSYANLWWKYAEQTPIYEEYQNDGDTKSLMRAIQRVAEAKGGISKLAEDTKLNRQNLYRIFANQTSPRFDTLTKILRALGFTFSLKSFNTSKSCDKIK